MEVDRSNQKRVFRCRLLAAMDNEQTIDRDIDDLLDVVLRRFSLDTRKGQFWSVGEEYSAEGQSNEGIF